MICRYSSIILIIVNMIGFFYHHFSPQICARYFYVGIFFKGMAVQLPYTIYTPESDRYTVFQVMESQAIMAIRWVLSNPFRTLESDNELQDV